MYGMVWYVYGQNNVKEREGGRRGGDITVVFGGDGGGGFFLFFLFLLFPSVLMEMRVFVCL